MRRFPTLFRGTCSGSSHELSVWLRRPDRVGIRGFECGFQSIGRNPVAQDGFQPGKVVNRIRDVCESPLRGSDALVAIFMFQPSEQMRLRRIQ